MPRPYDRLEPQYAREVFERLRETLDVVLTDRTAIRCKDAYIAPNYELRDDGAWLRANEQEDALNWTPACDAEEGLGSPDPLTTPALPFPFTARQLAAFLLDGWGWFLHARFADEDGQLDLGTVQALLGSVRDAKPREAIAAAFAALAQARQHVGEADASVFASELAAVAAFETATARAERLHDGREGGITERERSARVQRRNEMTAAAKAALGKSQSAREKDHSTWRRATVRWLLGGGIQAAEASSSTRPMPRAQAQENAILAKFSELGIDPMKLPRPKPGKSCPPVAKVRAALGYSTDVMQKAMARLLRDGTAAYTDASAD